MLNVTNNWNEIIDNVLLYALAGGILYAAAIVFLMFVRWRARRRLSLAVHQLTTMYGEIAAFEQERVLCARFIHESHTRLEV